MLSCILTQITQYFDANKDAIWRRLHPYLVRVNKKGRHTCFLPYGKDNDFLQRFQIWFEFSLQIIQLAWRSGKKEIMVETEGRWHWLKGKIVDWMMRNRTLQDVARMCTLTNIDKRCRWYQVELCWKIVGRWNVDIKIFVGSLNGWQSCWLQKHVVEIIFF